MAVERLAAADQIMLWADQRWPQDIGALAVLDSRGLLDSAGQFQVERVLEALAGRLHLVSRLRQMVCIPPTRLGEPFWVDDPNFDLGRHVGVVDVPPPGGESEVLATVERLRSRRLDPSRALWEMWFLTGMQRGRTGMYVRTHHAVADGIAGVATLGAFLDVSPDVAPTPAEPWAPAPPPAELELLVDDRNRRLAARRRRLSAVAHPVRTSRLAARAWPAMSELFAEPAVPRTSLDAVVGPARRFALVRTDLDSVKEVAHAHGAKVNDVLLTVIAGGLRALLRGRGEAMDGSIRIHVPISLRRGRFDGAQGNEVAQMVVPLPAGVADPLERLRLIAEETRRRKARPRSSVGALPTRGIASRLMLMLISRERVNVESADVPGPPVPLYLAGARVLEIFPLLPLIGKVTVGVGALSYAGQFNIGVVADREVCPDIDVLAAGIGYSLRELAEGSAAGWPLNLSVTSG